MIDYSDQTSRTRYMRLTFSPFVTVGELIAFADRLRNEKIPRMERVVDHQSEDTRHLVGLSVRVTEEQTTPQIAESSHG